jgi:2-haloacid dehalogenase
VDWESGIISGLRPVLRSHGVEATDDEILDLHARTEHGLPATSKKGAYLKYRDVLGEEVREAGRRWGFDPSPSGLARACHVHPIDAKGLGSTAPKFPTARR